MKILHIDSSIQGGASVSRMLSAAVVERLKTGALSAEVVYRDLGAAPLPHLDFETFAAISTHPVLREFLDADVIVIGAPMYNFGISSQLKAWIDHIVVAGQTFRYEPEGVIGLAGEKRVIVAHSRGGVYSEGPAVLAEHAEAHLRTVFGFIGVADLEFVVAEGVALGDGRRKEAIGAAHAKIGELAPADIQKAA